MNRLSRVHYVGAQVPLAGAPVRGVPNLMNRNHMDAEGQTLILVSYFEPAAGHLHRRCEE